jgi:hypothetical protein
VNPTKDLKYIGNKFLQNWSNSRKFMKSPNALKTQAKCGEIFLGIFKKKVLKSWQKFQKKGEIATKKYSHWFYLLTWPGWFFFLKPKNKCWSTMLLYLTI